MCAHTHARTHNHSSSCDKGRVSQEAGWLCRPRCHAGLAGHNEPLLLSEILGFQNMAVPLVFSHPQQLLIFTLLLPHFPSVPSGVPECLVLRLHYSVSTQWLGDLLVIYSFKYYLYSFNFHVYISGPNSYSEFPTLMSLLLTQPSLLMSNRHLKLNIFKPELLNSSPKTPPTAVFHISANSNSILPTAWPKLE